MPIEGPHLADKFLLDSLPMTAAQYGLGEARPVTPDRWLDQGDTVQVGALTFDILHCPGHSRAAWCSSAATRASPWWAT